MGIQLAEKSNVGWAAVKGNGQFVNLWWEAVLKISQTWGGGETFRVPSPWLENFEPGPKSCQT